jgi:hypothetical protein
MTLTEAAFWTKRFGVVVLGILGVFVLFVIIYIFRPTAPPDPKYQEGNFACTANKEEFAQNLLTIPSLEILNEETSIDISIATDTGTYDDDLPDYVNVYRYVDLGQKLNAQAEAKILAKGLGFEPEEIRRNSSNTNYLWQDRITGRSLNVTARDQNFVFNTDVSMIREVRSKSDLPTESEAISLATNALRSLGKLKEDFAEMITSVHLINIEGDDSYSEAESLLEAELIRVDFLVKIPLITLRTDLVGVEPAIRTLQRKGMTYEIGEEVIDEERVEVYKFNTLITHQNPVKSNVSVYVGAKNENFERLVLPNIYKIEYTTWTIDPISCGTYRLIEPSVAAQRVQNGEGSIVFINYNNDEVIQYQPQLVKNFIMTDVYITYYEGQVEQNYLQPVYTFEGVAELEDGTQADYYIYYPAIDYDSLEDRKELEEPEINSGGSAGGFLFP